MSDPDAYVATAAPVRKRPSMPLVLVLLAAIGFSGWTLRTLSHEESVPVPEVEVSRFRLALTDGRLCRVGQTIPFTGWLVEHYREGGPKSRSHVTDGRLEGVSEGWHTNGVLQVREHFRAGVSHGPRTKWFDSGKKLSEAGIVNGKLHGPFRRWHENGVLAEEMELKDGEPDGIARAWHPSGFVKAEVRLREGKPVEQRHWEDGLHKTFPAAPPAGSN